MAVAKAVSRRAEGDEVAEEKTDHEGPCPCYEVIFTQEALET